MLRVGAGTANAVPGHFPGITHAARSSRPARHRYAGYSNRTACASVL
ncbi:MAG: hypothetical protein ABSE46_24745 [Terracidiphilus sp.]